MENKIKIIIIIFFSQFLLISCRKYAEGPSFDLQRTNKLIRGNWKITSLKINSIDKILMLDSLFGFGGTLIIKEFDNKNRLLLSILWNQCNLQTLGPCKIKKSTNPSLSEEVNNFTTKDKKTMQIRCDFASEFPLHGYCFNNSIGYLLFPTIYEETRFPIVNNNATKYYGGSIEILNLNKKTLKLAWKRSREPYKDEILVMELRRE